MRELRAAFWYECSNKIIAMCIFYLIEYAVVALIFGIVAICTGGKESGSNVLEISSVVFLSVVGVLGYQEDFKALLQNGYTRKYIFLATICMFLFMSGTMALIDTVIGYVARCLFDGYFTLFSLLYGPGSFLANWLWLVTLYLAFCCLFYLAVLVIKRVGKTTALLIGVGLGGLILLVIALFRFVFSGALVVKISSFLLKAMGFMGHGRINSLYPILTLLVIGTAFSLGAYALIRRAELR